MHRRKFPICAYIRERFPAPYVFVENDANAAAWGEAVAGAARGTHNSVMITLGTGVGGGIIIDDKVYSGFNYAGAELGHIVIVTDGEPCGCGRHGCWEAYSSATALIRMTARALDAARADGRQTLMEDMVAKAGKVSGRTAFDAMRAGDAVATEVVNTYLHYLAQGLSNIINIFQPEVLSIGGGISNEGDSLLETLVPLIRAEVYGHGVVPDTRICIAELKNNAGIIGGAVRCSPTRYLSVPGVAFARRPERFRQIAQLFPQPRIPSPGCPRCPGILPGTQACRGCKKQVLYNY